MFKKFLAVWYKRRVRKLDDKIVRLWDKTDAPSCSGDAVSCLRYQKKALALEHLREVIKKKLGVVAPAR